MVCRCGQYVCQHDKQSWVARLDGRVTLWLCSASCACDRADSTESFHSYLTRCPLGCADCCADCYAGCYADCCPDCCDACRCIATGRQIRNTGTLGGNIATASPISDLNPLWMAFAATFTVISAEGTRTLPASKFFLGYRWVLASGLWAAVVQG